MAMSETFEGREDGVSKKENAESESEKGNFLVDLFGYTISPPDSKKSSSIVDRDDESNEGRNGKKGVLDGQFVLLQSTLHRLQSIGGKCNLRNIKSDNKEN